ncbi:YqaA family protein [Arenibaculum pallidiluteum]|uniref:YqaA family protein n=1 Tax=Arenibaculum pallidiluteum TaxID=2812559 RepID=UPI001A95D9C5|nr:YqaA family protein [Arenibaculum pallidiluteum]
MAKAGSRSGPAWLGAVSFAESSFFPIPPDIMLIPMVLARREQWWRLAAWCTLTSVLGGLAGYAIGLFLFEAIGEHIVAFYHLDAKFAEFRELFQNYGGEILLIKGMTPIPYKLLTITAGVARLDLWVFIAASVVSRSMRFFLVAALLYKFGPPIQTFVEKRLTLVTTAAVVLVILGFAAVKLF